MQNKGTICINRVYCMVPWKNTAYSSLHSAGFTVRALAHIIDLFAILPISFLSMSMTSKAASQIESLVISAILDVLIPVLLTFLFWMRLKATPGKYILGLQVVDAVTFEALTLKQSVFRYLGYIVCIASFGVGFLAIFFNEQNQGWHDKLSRSCVIKK